MSRLVKWPPQFEQRRGRYARQPRRLIIELLESRNLLASVTDPEQDPEFGDAVIVSNYIDVHGPGRVPLNPASNEANFDVNGDGWITAKDVLFLINLVNERREAEGDEDGGDREDEEDDELNDSTGSGPPDTMGAVGTGQIVEMLNTGYTVYDKATRKVLSPTVSTTNFWNDALAGFAANQEKTGRATDPRVIYDLASGRWFASALGHSIFIQANQVLLAVSKSSDPRDGWVGFVFHPDASGVASLDFPQLGLNADAVYLVANMLDLTSAGHSGTALISVPKNDLLTTQPTIDHATVNPLLTDPSHFTPDVNKVLPGFGSQPVVDFGPSGGTEAILSNAIAPTPVRYDVFNGGGPGPATINGTSHVNLHSELSERWGIAFVVASPPQPIFYIRGNPSVPVNWSTDWTTLRDNLQAGFDQMFGPGNSGIVDGDMENPEARLFNIYLSPELPPDAPQLTNIQNGNANFELETGRVFDELQRLAFGGGISGGSFTLEAPGKSPQRVAWDANRAVLIGRVRSALDTLYGVGDVAVVNAANGALDIKFGGKLAAADVPQLIVDSTELTGTSATVSALTIVDGAGTLSMGPPLQPDRMAIMDPAGIDLRTTVQKQGDSYWMAYTGSSLDQTISTPPISFGPTPGDTRANMQAALDAAVGAGRSTVTATSSTTFEIRFIGPFSQIVHFSYNSAYNFEVLDDAIRITFPDDGPPSNQFTFNLNFRGRAMVRWMEVDAATNQIKQAGNISSPSLSFYYPSLAVNEAGDVVIGFSGSGSTQFPSAYYVIGHKVDGYTTFTKPRLLQAGSGNYDGRWGDYSATVLDPSDPTLFWTFQEYTVADDKWGVKIAAIRATGPGSHDYGQSHNLLLPVDVTADGDVAADDVVSIINFIAAYGAVEVEPNSLGTPYCDVDGDGWITATDVVMVINYINAHPLSLADLI